MNVTVYGDSILRGVRFQDGRYVIDRSWEERLAETFGLQITNRSRFGNTLPKAMPRIERDSETACEGEEYALLELGGNDCDYDWAAVSDAPEASLIARSTRAFSASSCARTSSVELSLRLIFT